MTISSAVKSSLVLPATLNLRSGLRAGAMAAYVDFVGQKSGHIDGATTTAPKK